MLVHTLRYSNSQSAHESDVNGWSSIFLDIITAKTSKIRALQTNFLPYTAKDKTLLPEAIL